LRCSKWQISVFDYKSFLKSGDMSKMTNIVKLSLNSKTITDEVNGIAETLETQTDAIKQINNGVELNRIIVGHNQQ
jgi:hypothetical protein